MSNLQSLISDINERIRKMRRRIAELNDPEYQDKFTGLWIDLETKEQSNE